MSATREILCEKISVFEEALEKAFERGIPENDKDVEYLKNELLVLRKQLSVVNKVLSEGSSILKG